MDTVVGSGKEEINLLLTNAALQILHVDGLDRHRQRERQSVPTSDPTFWEKMERQQQQQH